MDGWFKIKWEGDKVVKERDKKEDHKLVCGIYGIFNNIKNKWYVGQSKDIYKRWEQHRKCKETNEFHKDLKNNIQDFSFVILCECDENLLNRQERRFCKICNSFKGGYNIRKMIWKHNYKVYCVFDELNNKRYIGRTLWDIDVDSFCSQYGKGKHKGTWRFELAWSRRFKVEILCQCDNLKDSNYWVDYYINQYDTLNESKGYNKRCKLKGGEC